MRTAILSIVFFGMLSKCSAGNQNHLHFSWSKYERGWYNQITPYETKYFEQRIDHFSFVNTQTYKQRYLINDQHWNVNGGPIFYFVGCEGPIDTSAGHSVRPAYDKRQQKSDTILQHRHFLRSIFNLF